MNNLHLCPYTQCTEKVGVHPIDNVHDFNNEINNLNNIIANEYLLSHHIKKYYALTTKSVLVKYEPFNNRLFQKLFLMHLLPSMVSKKRFLAIWNYLECEAHRDKQLYAFRNLFK